MRLPLLASCCLAVACGPLAETHPLPEGPFGEIEVLRLNTPEERQIDVLFVIDNSRGTGHEQATLVGSMEALVAALQAPDRRADFHVAVTTTDDGNTWCQGSTPEAGAFVFSSCLNRGADFVSADATEDEFERVCSSRCALDDSALGISGVSDPWLSVGVDGTSNLPAGVDIADALACLVPQGVSGCGFESPLESMNKALIRASTNEVEHGFLRETASLVVVFLTNEVDCSANYDHQEIFDDAGTRVFWSDPTAPFPTSAICWNAGTECMGDPADSSCISADRGIDGEVLDPDVDRPEDDAVLHPLSRYIERIHSSINGYVGDQAMIVTIAGVATDGVPSYDSTASTAWLDTYGIGAGCQGPVEITATPCTVDDDCIHTDATCGTGGTCEIANPAIPPVRLAEFTSEFADDALFSICDDDYSAAMHRVAASLPLGRRSICYPGDPLDTDPDTPALDPECTITQSWGPYWSPAGSADPDAVGPVLECARGEDGAYALDPDGRHVIPEDADGLCFAYRVEASDLSEECEDRALEIVFEIDYALTDPDLSGVQAVCRVQ